MPAVELVLVVARVDEHLPTHFGPLPHSPHRAEVDRRPNVASTIIAARAVDSRARGGATRAWGIRRYKAPLELMELERPTPGPGDLLVRVRAASINPVDLKIRD